MLGKIVLLKFFPLFQTKDFGKKYSFIKIVTRFRYISSKSIEYFHKKSFLLKFSFPWEIFFRKLGKNVNKTIFFNIYKRVGKNLIMPSDEGYLVTSRKIF